MPSLTLSPKAFLADVGTRAGNIIRKFREPDVELGVTLKLDRTHVTRADLAISAMLREMFVANFPTGHLLSEEGGYGHYAGKGVAVLADELDGTKAFIEGSEEAVFAGLYMVDGVPKHAHIEGPLFLPPRVFTACQGHGAYLNGTKIAVSQNRGAKLNVIVGTAGGIESELYNAAPIIAAIEGAGHTFREMLSSCYSGCLVASGEVDAVVFPWNTPHDAIAALIVEEAGGCATDLYGEPIDFSKPTMRGYVMANSPTVLADMIARVAPHLRSQRAA